MAGSVSIRHHNGCPGQGLMSVNFGIHWMVNIYNPHTVSFTVTNGRVFVSCFTELLPLNIFLRGGEGGYSHPLREFLSGVFVLSKNNLKLTTGIYTEDELGVVGCKTQLVFS